VSGDPAPAEEALSALEMGVLHERGIYSCTAPAALFGAAALGDRRSVRRPRSCRRLLLSMLDRSRPAERRPPFGASDVVSVVRESALCNG
jgi:hypothetical protein